VGVYEPALDDESRGVPGGLVAARRSADVAEVLERDNVLLREKKRRLEDVRFSGAKVVGGEDKGGELGPRRSFRRCSAASQSVQGWVWDSPRCPQPLCCVKLR
jgi:hypothetical protein